MKGWIKILVAVLPALIILVLLIIFLHRWCCSKRRKDFTDPRTRKESLQSKLHLAYSASSRKIGSVFHRNGDLHLHGISDKRSPNYYVIRRESVSKRLFNWADHPWLVSEAVENGWPRFAFTSFVSVPLSPSTKTKLWDFCAACDFGKEKGEAEISWDVGSGSADSMQKIRFNLPSKKTNGNDNSSKFSYVRSMLPLPGPPLGNSSFPQVAYFEITILSGEEENSVGPSPRDSSTTSSEADRIKLIQETTSIKAQSDALIHSNSGNNGKKIEESKADSGLITLGLVGDGAPPSNLPGRLPGTIGFNSNGSVYLDGIRLIFETDKSNWRRGNKVIGCGFDPGQKKVFFTADSELVHAIRCRSEEFSTPLYPTIATNINVEILINLGQSEFKYRPANCERTPNPCFLRPSADVLTGHAIGYEDDSQELFSMGRIESQWLRTKKDSANNNDEITTTDINADEESEADMIEIVLDDSFRHTTGLGGK